MITAAKMDGQEGTGCIKNHLSPFDRVDREKSMKDHAKSTGREDRRVGQKLVSGGREGAP